MPIPTNKIVDNTGVSSRLKIYNHLKKWILEGQLKPLEKLDDTEIAEYFSVSRTPVREAYQLLENKKLIVTSPGKSTIVSAIETQNIIQIYAPLIALQRLIVENYIENFTQDDIAFLEQTNAEFKEGILQKSTVQILQKDQDFHRYIINKSNNDYIIDFLNMLMDHVYRVEYLFFNHTPDLMDSYKEHCDLIQAIQRKDSISAPFLMKKHWERTLLLVNLLIEENKD